MKPIQLTEDHRIKLLEMCKELFSEYDEYTFFNGDFIGMYYIINDEESVKDSISIHWFEFCLNILSLHLFQKIDDDLSEIIKQQIDMYKNCLSLNLLNEKVHLIDHLYNKFKKLKL